MSAAATGVEIIGCSMDHNGPSDSICMHRWPPNGNLHTYRYVDTFFLLTFHARLHAARATGNLSHSNRTIGSGE